MTISRLFASAAVALATTAASAQDASPRLLDSTKSPGELSDVQPTHGAAFRIKSTDHTGFTVSSLEDSLAFWVGVLGFKLLYTQTFENGPFIEEVVGVPGAALRLAMVEGPGHMIELLEYTSPNDRRTYMPRSSDVGSVHLAFYVENIDALVARTTSVGWPPVGKIQTVESGERKGLRLIYVRGPNGITLEFLQRPDNAAN